MNMLKRFLIAFLMVVALLPFVPAKADASLLKNAVLTISDPRSLAANVTHTFYWVNQTANIGGITMQYCIRPSDTCATTGASGASASLTSITFDGGAESNWTYSWDAAAFRNTLKNPSTNMAPTGGDQYIITIGDMANPNSANCTFTSTATSNTCYVRIATYLDSTLATPVDDTVVSLTLTGAVTVTARVDPLFTLLVAGFIGDGATLYNGTTMTNGLTTTPTTIPFGNMAAGVPRYGGHTLTVVSNTDGGYTVNATMDVAMVGAAYTFDIDPFIGGGATTTNSESWASPNGSTAGTNTGWLGVGTNDSDVPGQASNQFFSLGTGNTLVMLNVDSTTGESNQLAYGIEVNASQPADNYTGTMLYIATPTY